MVSREPTGALRTILPAAALGLAGVLGITGCSAGQVTQTDSVQPAVNGNTGQVGEISLRDVRVAYPADGAYEEGDEVPLLLTIVNDGDEATALESVSVVDENVFPGDAELLGNPSLPGRYGLHVVMPEEPTGNEAPETTGSGASETSVTATSEPESSSPETPSTETSDTSGGSETTTTEQPTRPAEEPEVGTLSIVFADLQTDLQIGRNLKVLFRFADGSEIELALPTAAPTTPREDPPAEEEGGH